MTYVTIEGASDDALRQTKVLKRFRVLRACQKPFEEELAMIRALQVIAERWAPGPKTFWQRANFLRTLDDWWRRIGAAFKVMRLTHAINERRKGFEWSRRQAQESAFLFACPRFVQGYFAGKFLKRAIKRKAEEDADAERAGGGDDISPAPVQA